MDLGLVTAAWADFEADWLIVPLVEPLEFTPQLQLLDQRLGGQLRRMQATDDLSTKLGAVDLLLGVTGIAAKRVLLVGLGPAGELTAGRLDRALTTACRAISDKPKLSIAFAIPENNVGGVSTAGFISAAIVAAHVGSIGQDLYKADRGRYPFARVTLVGPQQSPQDLQPAVEQGRILGEAINLTRELVNRPPCEITPDGFAQRALVAAQESGLRIEIFDQSRLERERMGALLAVARGSIQPPRLVIVEHQGAGPDAPKLALVGKGVTFDSGGLSLKSNENMLDMKCDMAGAATVLGAMTAIARLKLPVNVIGFMGLVENMPGGNAFKLGDILTARNGVTIEVLNTDAEGRLVLADVLSYAIDLGVAKLVDLATLTGACVVALGENVVGAMTNEQDWCTTVMNNAQACGELMWQLPMFDVYEDQIKGDVGDIKNTGGRWGGAITAAKFLEHFVDKRPWVHLDIAGPAFAASNKPYREAGATGVMVRTLVETARNFGPS